MFHSITFHTAVLSEAGGRENNEDNCLWAEAGRNVCWVVADGLGGHNGGELASKTASTALVESFKLNPKLSVTALEGHLASAQAAVLALQKEPSFSQMRTTVVVLLTDARKALWAHVGDSRLYQFHRNGLVAQTEDHSVPQALVKAGDIRPEELRGHKDRNRLLRSVGEPGPVRATVLDRPRSIAPGDAFLLCTDGLWEYVLETEMMADLSASASPEEWLKRMVSRLQTRASGNNDNYSAIAILAVSAKPVGKAAPSSEDASLPPITREEFSSTT